MTHTPNTPSELLAMHEESKKEEATKPAASAELLEAAKMLGRYDLNVVDTLQLAEILFLNSYKRLEANVKASNEESEMPGGAMFAYGRLLGLLSATGRDLGGTVSEVVEFFSEDEDESTEEDS